MEKRAPMSIKAATAAILAADENNASISAAYARTLARMYPDIVQSRGGSIPEWMISSIRKNKIAGRYIFDEASGNMFHVAPTGDAHHLLVALISIHHGQLVHRLGEVTQDDYKKVTAVYQRTLDFFCYPHTVLQQYLQIEQGDVSRVASSISTETSALVVPISARTRSMYRSSTIRR